MSELLTYWRARQYPIIHIQHESLQPNSPLRPGQEGVEFMTFAQPFGQELVLKKQVNSAFIGTALESILKEAQIKNLVIMGIATDHCVSTTTRMAANLGFKVSLSADALYCFDRKDHTGNNINADLIHQSALASLHEEFATVYTQDNLLKKLGAL